MAQGAAAASAATADGAEEPDRRLLPGLDRAHAGRGLRGEGGRDAWHRTVGDGMPVGAPGMDGPAQDRRSDPFEVLLIGRDGRTSVFARYGNPRRGPG
jgi:hypothetical protein